MKLTRSDPTAEFIGPKKGNIMAKNQIGMTTGNLAAARLHMLLHSCIPINFSHTKYNGVHANPNVINYTNKIRKKKCIKIVTLSIRVFKIRKLVMW